MARKPRRAFWIEVAGAVISSALFLLTLLSQEWIEVVFGVDPDHGNGSLEWVLVVSSALLTITLVVLARLEWRKTASSSA